MGRIFSLGRLKVAGYWWNQVGVIDADVRAWELWMIEADQRDVPV